MERDEGKGKSPGGKKDREKETEHQKQKPVGVEDASLKSKRSQENDEQNGPQIEPSGAVNSVGEKHVEERNTYDCAGFDDITTNARHSRSTSSLTGSSSPKALVRSFSCVAPFS
ncbi:Uncharacterized protein Fot_24554 [Forsythia ovata]|uniref:Uncharacterized protein n=1 Tax=Forsythia ovata TaxID=205694 RepID=A0ABD1U6J0_9LAMI